MARPSKCVVVIILLSAAATSCARARAEPVEAPFTGDAGWKQTLPNGFCFAHAATSALGCTVAVGVNTYDPVDGGDVLVMAADKKVHAGCDETVDACGHAYRCECEKCDGSVDYASRMTRGRREEVDPPDERGIFLFTVRYDGGKCEGVGDPHYGSAQHCMVSAWDDSHVGGCYRHTTEPGTGEFSCGQFVKVCGIRVRCDCPDAGVQVLTVERQ